MIRFFRSTATFRADAFFETSPMAIAARTQPDSIQEEAALISKEDPSLSAGGPPHSVATERMLPGRIRAADKPAAVVRVLWWRTSSRKHQRAAC